MNYRELFEAVTGSFADSDIRSRNFYPDFRRKWESLFRSAMDKEAYFDVSSPTCFTVEHSFAGMDTAFHFDQAKIDQWYTREIGSGKRVVFTPTRMKRDREGLLLYQGSACSYDANAPEPTIDEGNRNVIAAALLSGLFGCFLAAGAQ